MARTELFVRKQPGGVFAIAGVDKHPGSIFFVHSGTGTDGAGYGRNPDAPVATLDYAVGLCTANKGDTIYVLPGHAETIAGAAGVNLDVIGISVVGLGNGANRPTFSFSAVASTIAVGAAGVRLANLVIEADAASTILLDINADDCTVEHCELREGDDQAVTYVDLNGGANGADRCAIRRCKITSIGVGATQGIEIGAVEDALVIEDCWIDGDFSAAGIHSASIFTNALVAGNVVSNRQAGDHAIEFTAACTGLLVDNRLYGDTLGTILDPGSLKCLGNLETDAVDQAGVDSPRTSAGGLADNSITAASIATDAIDADALADGAITAATFAAGAVDAAAIAAGAIDAGAFAAGAIDAAAIAAGAIDAATFAAGAIDAAAIATNAIDADAMADGAITAATFAAGAIDAAAIANASIDAATFAAGAIDAAAIATNAIDADAMADGAITAATFAAGAIDATAIANSAIDSDTFAAGAVNAAAIAASALTATKFAGSIENCVEKSDGALLNGADNLFTITGGPIKAQVFGLVTTVVGAVVATGQLRITTTTPAATVNLSTAVAIEDDAAGTSYRFVGATGVLTPDTNGAKIIDPVTVEDDWFLLPIGTVTFFCSAANTGVVAWYLRYKPLSPSSVVVAAA